MTFGSHGGLDRPSDDPHNDSQSGAGHRTAPDRLGPGALLAVNQLRATSVLFDANIGDTTGGPARWFGLPVGTWVEPTDYWLAVTMWDTTIGSRLNFAAGGTDRYYDAGGDWVADGGAYAITTTANNYSIRANIVTL